MLTVREQLLYTAELKLPTGVPAAAKAARVAELIAELGLASCAHTPIGNVLARRISGGQAKRCNIGVALVARPPILLLDEPTTGLDTATADDVTALCASLARGGGGGGGGGRAVVATLHAPSSRAFRLVDKLVVLVGGRVVWAGAPHGGALVDHLTACGFPYQPGDALADHVISVVGGGVGAASAFAAERGGGKGKGAENKFMNKSTGEVGRGGVAAVSRARSLPNDDAPF